MRRGTSPIDRLIVAGGGGGGGGVGTVVGYGPGDPAQYKGGDSGHAAPEGGFPNSFRSGQPGTDTRGGFGGGSGDSTAGSDGGLAGGGIGGQGSANEDDGGGGGGGLYGGGGGQGGSVVQAGGSNYTIPGFGGGGGSSKTAGGTLVDGANHGDGSAVITYSVPVPNITPPSIAIASPADGATYTQGQTVAATYACSGPGSTTVTSCTGPVASGTPVDTSLPGSYTFTVTAQDGDGGSATKSTTYTVTAVNPPAQPPPPAPTTPPTIEAAHETAVAWRENDLLARFSAGSPVPVGTTFSFALSQPATVTLSFTQPAAGRLRHRRCQAPNAQNRHYASCTRTIVRGRLTFSGHAGPNRVRFGGRLSRTVKLRRGRYTLVIIAVNARHKRSAPRSLTFTIVR